MSSSRIGVLLAGVLLVSGAARAQSPEDEWGGLPSQPVPPPPPAGEQPPPPPPPSFSQPPPPVAQPQFQPPQNSATLLRPRAEVLNRVRLVEERNLVSMHGAPSLGAGRRGQTITLGFPMLSIRALFGVADWLDLGVGFDSYWFLMNEPRAAVRFGLVRGESWSFAASLEGGYAFFSQRASRESLGSRWITGRRNINVSPALHVAYQGQTARAARIFFELRYTMAFDTEPYASNPLGGLPPDVVVGHNVGLKGGAELPLSAKTAFMFAFGFDIHGRAEDSVAMPLATVGLVTSL